MTEKDGGKIKLHATQEAQLLRDNWQSVESIHFWNMKGNKLHRYSLRRNTFETFKLHSRKVCYKNNRWGLPWWRSGWESACQCRAHRFGPWSGRIPHAAERLGPWTTITEPACLEPVLRNKRGRDSEGPAHCDEEWSPLATTRESPRTETKTQHSHK